MSDVPIGIFLSGGVDSTAILALAQEAGAKELTTFTVGFDDPVYDERARARKAAEHFGTNHLELCVHRPDFLDAWARLAWYRDDPIAEASEVPLLLLSEFAATPRKGRPVRRRRGRSLRRLSQVPRRCHAPAPGPLSPPALGRAALPGKRPTHRRLDRAAETLAIRDEPLRWASWFRSFSPGDLSAPARRARRLAQVDRLVARSPPSPRSVRRRRSGSPDAARRFRHLPPRQHALSLRPRTHGRVRRGSRAAPRPSSGRARRGDLRVGPDEPAQGQDAVARGRRRSDPGRAPRGTEARLPGASRPHAARGREPHVGARPALGADRSREGCSAPTAFVRSSRRPPARWWSGGA